MSVWYILTPSWCAFFLAAYVYVHYYMLKDYQVKSLLVQIIFSATFALSAGLLELFLLELAAIE